MANRFWVGGSGTWDASSTTNWAATSGGAGGVSAPTTADVVFFDANSGTAATVTVASTAATGATTVDKSDITLSLSGNATLAVQSNNFTLTSGTLTLNNNTLTVGRFASSNTNVRTINFGTGDITVTGNSFAGVLGMNTITGFVYSGTPTFNCTYSGSVGTRIIRAGNTAGGSSATAVTVNITAGTDIVDVGGHFLNLNYTGYKGAATAAVGRFIYGNLTFDSGMTISSTGNFRLAGTSGVQQITTNGITVDTPFSFDGVGGTFAFQDALTQGSTRAFTITNGTVQLKAGVTSTVGSFVANNANVKFLQSTTPGSQATLSQALGTVNVVDLTIRDINAVGGASWNAYTDFENTDAGNNDGWNFSLSPPYSTAEFPIALRSFTQPRRF
jgi:hypothetical protein